MQQLQIKNNITSLELLEQINMFRNEIENKSKLRHDDLLNVIRNEFEEEISLRKISESEYTNSRNRKYPMFILTLSQAKQVLVRESKYVRRAVIKYIEELENKLNNLQPVIKRLYWSNQPVMTIEMFSKCIGVSSPSVNFALQNMNNNDILFGDDLKKFKKDNDLKSSCNMLRYITHRVAMQLAEKFNKSCDLFLKYYILMEDRFKLPIEQMKIALRQASLMCASYSQIRDKVVKEAIALQVTKILSNIGLWDKELDTEIDKDLDNESLLGWSKRCIIQNNISGLSLI